MEGINFESTKNQVYESLIDMANKRRIIVKDINLVSSGLNGLYNNDGEHEIILLNESNLKNPNMKNYVLAHEIAHSILHIGFGNITKYNGLREKNKYEIEADMLAETLIKIMEFRNSEEWKNC